MSKTKKEPQLTAVTIKNPSSILSHVLVENGVMRSTDLKEVVFTKTDLEDGVYFYTGKTYISTQDKPSFPPFVKKEAIASFNTTELDCNRLLEATGFVSKDESRYYMQGICLDRNNVIGTDGRIMYQAELSFTVPYGRPIVPITKNIKKILDPSLWQSPLIITLNNGQIGFKRGATEIWATLIDGQFVQWDRVIPSNLDRNKRSIVISPDLLKLILEFKSKPSSPMHMAIDSFNGEVYISGLTAEIAFKTQRTVHIGPEGYKKSCCFLFPNYTAEVGGPPGESTYYGFDVDLVKVLNNVGAERLFTTGSHRQVLWGISTNGGLCLIMPLLIAEK